MRKTKFQNDYYYHIYNRGVDKRDIFMDEKDYIRFLVSMREFNTLRQIDNLYRQNYLREKDLRLGAKSPIGDLAPLSGELVEIICYALLPNHFHILLKQITENGISKFLHKLSSGYTSYFNYKYNRSGSLFQGVFKSVPVKSDSYLLKLSCYINGNPEIHKISKAENYKWCSYPDYLGKRNGTLCNKNIILKDFANIQEYKNLVDVIIKESRQRKDDIKKYLLE
ncbi:transposase [Candidatus Parcubacteria bacterium]|nr:transposase [Candidatus Parcubacteria bacterium]